MENFTDMRGADRFSKPEARKKFDSIISEGPGLGIFTIVAAQTLARGSVMEVKEFGLQVCFQVSENDSRALFDSDAGSKLRPQRAAFRRYDWGFGRIEKFKPYRLIKEEDIRKIWGGNFMRVFKQVAAK